jgi:phosphoribosylanthranilate isomerase
MTYVKICGIRSVKDAEMAAAAGADFLGLVFAPSPRRVDLALAGAIRDALPGGPPRVGVFDRALAEDVRAAVTAGGLAYVQLHGEYETTDLERTARAAGRPYIRALRAGRDDPEAALALNPGPFALLLDTPVEGLAGGSGRTFDWALARDPARRTRLFLAGGLTPANVAAAIRAVEPYAVDVSSGVESAPGCKDGELVRAFIGAARAADRAPGPQAAE